MIVSMRVKRMLFIFYNHRTMEVGIVEEVLKYTMTSDASNSSWNRV